VEALKTKKKLAFYAAGRMKKGIVRQCDRSEPLRGEMGSGHHGRLGIVKEDLYTAGDKSMGPRTAWGATSQRRHGAAAHRQHRLRVIAKENYETALTMQCRERARDGNQKRERDPGLPSGRPALCIPEGDPSTKFPFSGQKLKD